MAEYKNGFNAFGGIPVDSSRRSSDIQTGRAVYVNEDEYSDEPTYKAKADSIMNEGYHREAPFEAPEIVVPEAIIPSGTKSITENGIYDVTQFAKADVNVATGGSGGGGGSSDFSTAQVTFICSAPEDVEVSVRMATAEEAAPPFWANATSNGDFSLFNGDESVITAILYKGYCSIAFANAVSASGTGDISYIDSAGAKITGDCTITIS